MITDAMLREAAAEAERFMLAHLPEVQEPHVFSKRFERKMQKLISRMKHPIRYQVKRYVAAILLAVILLFGTIFAVSLEVRATVIGWVRSTFLEFFQYSNDDTSKPVIAEYELTIIPEGYRQLNIIDKEDGKTYLYVNNDGRKKKIGNELTFVWGYDGEFVYYSNPVGDGTHSNLYKANVNTGDEELVDCKSSAKDGTPYFCF
jgi:hypothetical protein